VGPLATRPDDIHTLLSGKTVEVNNTDAEGYRIILIYIYIYLKNLFTLIYIGRLVLSDGCFYASKFLNPSTIIDIATLTGAQLIATGKNHAALYCNDDALEALAVNVGKWSGDLTHPLPYCPEFYKQEFRSQVAIVICNDVYLLSLFTNCHMRL
jgi:probable aminopeptidase NPEPL1